MRNDSHRIVQKYEDSQLLSEEPARQTYTKKFTEEAVQNINIFKESIKNEKDIPRNIRDSEAIEVMHRRARLFTDLKTILKANKEELPPEVEQEVSSLLSQDY